MWLKDDASNGFWDKSITWLVSEGKGERRFGGMFEELAAGAEDGVSAAKNVRSMTAEKEGLGERCERIRLDLLVDFFRFVEKFGTSEEVYFVERVEGFVA
jgi:hypothetical protein